MDDVSSKTCFASIKKMNFKSIVWFIKAIIIIIMITLNREQMQPNSTSQSRGVQAGPYYRYIVDLLHFLYHKDYSKILLPANV